jgi:molybdopterin-guanine dinucleotide biosynthesis protein B
MHEHRQAPEATLSELVRHMSAVDLLIVEGFKREPHPKIEVHRPALGKPLLCRDDPNIVAVASDTALTGVAVPVLALDDAAAIARFILAHFRLEAA